MHHNKDDKNEKKRNQVYVMSTRSEGASYEVI